MKASVRPISGRGMPDASVYLQMMLPPLPGVREVGLAILMALTTPVLAQWVTVDSTFPAGSGPNAWVRTLAAQADGRVLMGGTFTNVSGSPHRYIARVGTNGVIDEGFVTQVSSEPTYIQALMDGERNVSELVAAVGGTQAKISRHLHTLTAAHIVTRRKEGLHVFYKIGDPSIPRLCELVCGSLEKTLSRQAGHLAEG